MTIKKYAIKNGSIFSRFDFGENMLEYGSGVFGIEVSPYGSDIIDEDVSEALEANEEFVRAAEEAGYDTSFRTSSAFYVYTQMFHVEGEDFLIDYGNGDGVHGSGDYNEVIKPFYDNFVAQKNQIREYLEGDDRIKILRSATSDPIDFDYTVEFDDSMFREVEDFLDETNGVTGRENAFGVNGVYKEKHFGVTVFKDHYGDPGSLQAYIEEIE